MSFDTGLEFNGMQLIFHPEDGLVQVVDKATFMIWEAFNQGYTPNEIQAVLDQEAPERSGQQNILELYENWKRNGFLDSPVSEPDKAAFSIIVQPSLESILVTTNNAILFDHIREIYRHVVPENIGHPYLSIRLDVFYSGNEEAYYIRKNNRLISSCHTLDEAVITVSFLIGDAAMKEEPRMLEVHAAAVVYHGKTMLMPARSRSGKSTLAAFFVSSGAKLIHDDTVPLNFDGSVTCINQPLKIKSGSLGILDSSFPWLNQSISFMRADGIVMKSLAVDRNSMLAPGERRLVDYIIVPEFCPEQDEPFIKKLDSTKKLEELIGADPYFPHHLTKTYLKRIMQWLSGIPAYKIKYKDSEQCIQLIHNKLISAETAL